MRLLNVETHKLEEFHIEIPPYAILSHTWEEEEVLYQDLQRQNINYTASQGWFKIKNACQQAIADGIAYIWVDTVCIDKSSSSELSESINSMFTWYRNSKVCYAYFFDVPANPFANSRWFTRGWTLQELIAPPQIIFFTKDWVPAGTKAALIDGLSAITGVDVNILRGGNLRLVSVARRLSWAARRQTTRLEDKAYCLLGIFGISMPMLYGEGTKAFTRLQEEIVREFDDQSIFVWIGNPQVDRGLLAPSPDCFVHSAAVVPCETRFKPGSEPITVTSRGIRVHAALQKLPDLAPNQYILPLRCKTVDFHATKGDRLGVILEARHDRARIFSRSDSDRIVNFQPDFHLEEKYLFVVKDDHLSDLDLGGDDITYWLRSLPIWPQGKEMKLVASLPHELWDEKNHIFRHPSNRAAAVMFALVFRPRNPGGDGYFLVFIGTQPNPNTTKHSPRPGMEEEVRRRLVCHVRSGRGLLPSDLDIMSEAYSFPPEGRISMDRLGDLYLKCYCKVEVLSGQNVYCADLTSMVREG